MELRVVTSSSDKLTKGALEETVELYLLPRNLNPRRLSPSQVADLARHFDLPGHPRLYDDE